MTKSKKKIYINPRRSSVNDMSERSLLLPIIAQNAFQYRVQVDRKEYAIEHQVQKGVSERKSQATKREFPRLMAIAPVEVGNVQGETPYKM